MQNLEPTTTAFRVLVVNTDPARRIFSDRRLSEIWPFRHDLKIEFTADIEAALDTLRRTRITLLLLDRDVSLGGAMRLLQAMRLERIQVPVLVVNTRERRAHSGELQSLAAFRLDKDRLSASDFYAAIAEALILLKLIAARN
jgi:DNA-binding response OmpR family regulator